MMSGIVTNGKMKLSLEHTFTGQVLNNVDSEHVYNAFDFSEGIAIPDAINKQINIFYLIIDGWDK